MAVDEEKVISLVQLSAANKQVNRILADYDTEVFPDNKLEELKQVLAIHTALRRTKCSSSVALEISTGIVRNGETPLPLSTPSIDALIQESVKNPDNVGSYIAGLHEEMMRLNPSPLPVKVANRLYRRPGLITRPAIIGHNNQLTSLVQAVRSTMRYDVDAQVNLEGSSVLRSVLLYGPPGTGKSSLCRYAIAEAQEIGSLVSVPVRFQEFSASDYSMWMGESSKAMKKKFSEVGDSSGVGIFAIDDIDMILQGREDSGRNHGLMQVTAELMHHLQGITTSYRGNVLFLATTNRMDLVDAALRRRFDVALEIPLYDSIKQYNDFVDRMAPWIDEKYRPLLASHALKNNYSPAALDGMIRSLDRYRRGPINKELFSLPPSRREEERNKQLVLLDEKKILGFLHNYSIPQHLDGLL